MKKNYLFMSIAAVSAILISSCVKNESTIAPNTASRVVSFSSLPSESTRTYFDAKDGDNYPTRWLGGETIKISLNEADVVTTTVTTSDNISAQWNYEFTDPSATSYRFYAFTPNCPRAIGSLHRIKLDVLPVEQTPTATSCDPRAMVLYSISQEYTSMPTEVTMPAFKHVTAYGCLTLAGLPEDAEVSKVVISSNAVMAGANWFYYNDPDDASDDEWQDYTDGTGVTSKNISVITSSKENIWFACRPTTELTELKVEAWTSQGIYTKTIEMSGKKFTAGRVAKFTVDGLTKSTEKYTYSWTMGKGDIKGGTSNIVGGVVSETIEGKGASPALTWTVTGTPSATSTYYVLFSEANVRYKMGTGADLVSPYVLTTTGLKDCKITSIAVWATSSATTGVSVSATVGGDSYITAQTIAKETTATKPTGFEYKGTGTSSGDVAITFTATKPYYLNKIEIEYENQ